MFLAALLLFTPLFAPLNDRQLPPPSNDFYFVAMGDNRPAGAGLPPTSTFKSLLGEISVLGPAFVISSGDLFYGNEESLEQYKAEEAAMRPLLDALPCPFFNAPGNHEINNRQDFLDEYTSQWGATYGTFEYGGVRFVAVCTELPAKRPSVFGDQMSWLRGTLSDPKPTVVFEHHPVFERPTNPDPKEEATVGDADALHKLYRTGGVKYVFEGHDHVFDRQTYDGVEYVIAGGAGAPLDGPPENGGYFSFVLVHCKDGRLEARTIPLGTLDVVQVSDGLVGVGNYTDADLPATNVRIECSHEPKSVSASVTSKTGKVTVVAAQLIAAKQDGDHFVAQVSLVLPKHKATFVKIGY